jgi:hypothetical protein
VTNAVSQKAAADLQKMRKGDAAAELRLTQVKEVPEVLTDQTLPVSNHFDRDDEDSDCENRSQEDGEASEDADVLNGAEGGAGNGIDGAAG